ncbi:hypothetical protein B566_EDAN002936 [Ephemera danica]|nr:hypothetical protein B566_EDAN002936 [Ephemera danica]
MITMEEYEPEPAVFPSEHLDPVDDAETLRGAMKGLGTDEELLIALLTQRTESQRYIIAQTYKEQYGRLHEAIAGAGTDEATLVDVLCPRTNNEIADICDAYLECTLFGTSLEEDLAGDTSGHFRRLLIVLVNEARHEWDPEDEDQARTDAESLFNAGEGMAGTDEETFNAILAHRSPPQLRLTFREYSALAGCTIEESITSEFSGTMQDALLTIGIIFYVLMLYTRAAYFAKRLHEAMNGAGTDETLLTRVVVSRAEIDLGTIKQEYERHYDRTLEGHIDNEVSGNFKTALLGLLG